MGKFNDNSTTGLKHWQVRIFSTVWISPEDVRNEVEDRVEKLAGDGGYIFCTAHNIQADTPIENVIALFDAYKEFG